MSDPALSRPPFIPEGTFRCCLCFEVFPEDEAHSSWEDGLPEDVCEPCGVKDDFATFILGWVMWVGHPGLGVTWRPDDYEPNDAEIIAADPEYIASLKEDEF